MITGVTRILGVLGDPIGHTSSPAMHNAAIAAMEEQGMAGTVPVSGLDCTVQAQQLILLGKQTQCGWRPLEDMAAAAAAVTVRLVAGEDFSDLGIFWLCAALF